MPNFTIVKIPEYKVSCIAPQNSVKISLLMPRQYIYLDESQVQKEGKDKEEEREEMKK